MNGPPLGRKEANHHRADDERESASNPRNAVDLLAAIVTSCESAIISKSLDGVIETWNPAAERLYGYTTTEAIGNPIDMLAPEDRPDEMPRILERIRAGKRVERLETVRRHKGGALVEVLLTVSPVHD